MKNFRKTFGNKFNGSTICNLINYNWYQRIFVGIENSFNSHNREKPEVRNGKMDKRQLAVTIEVRL